MAGSVQSYELNLEPLFGLSTKAEKFPTRSQFKSFYSTCQKAKELKETEAILLDNFISYWCHKKMKNAIPFSHIPMKSETLKLTAVYKTDFGIVTVHFIIYY